MDGGMPLPAPATPDSDEPAVPETHVWTPEEQDALIAAVYALAKRFAEER
jgi:hypothetical protein